jgi:hypothetical protein
VVNEENLALINLEKHEKGEELNRLLKISWKKLNVLIVLLYQDDIMMM